MPLPSARSIVGGLLAQSPIGGDLFPRHSDPSQVDITTSQPATPFLCPPTLPNVLAHMVGRLSQVDDIIAYLAAQCIVTITGPGGIGKTTVAVATAHALADAFRGAVYFVDFSSLKDPRQVAGTIANTIGLVVQAGDIAPSLIAHLSGRKLLLVFDNCEHLIGSIAQLAEQIVKQAAQVKILATSREALRVQGEQIYVLPPLETPPVGLPITKEALLTYSAAQLFVERIGAGGYAVEIDDQEAQIAAEICFKLDGMALAIELAAGRVSAYGIRGTADLLNSKIHFLWHGRRTAPQRQQTLNATLEWSYNLLNDVERQVLDRLSLFVGTFDVEAASAVAADPCLDYAVVLEILADLVGKSLVTRQIVAGLPTYRLLQTTGAYVKAKAAQSEDFHDLSKRHAIYFTAAGKEHSWS